MVHCTKQGNALPEG